MAFDTGLPKLAALGRSAGEAFFSTLVIGPNTDFRPTEAFVGDVDLLEPAVACRCLEVGVFDVSSPPSRDSGVLSTIELSEGLAFRVDLEEAAALPVVADLMPLKGTRCWLEDIIVAL